MTTYDTARDELLDAEVELMLQRERVAALRRSLPPGPVVTDYEFGSEAGPVELSQLFSSPDKPLVLYHFMFGRAQTTPCPSCSMWADGWNGIAEHLAARVDFAVVTAASPADKAALVAERGWTNLRWLSAANSSFKLDIGGEDDSGNQSPFISVYEKHDDGVRLTYSGGAHLRDEHWRGIDLLTPVWHFFDLARAGRGDWMPS
jgi:predicted dithiol-disulfide oxidoreductase (DUF899 family)